MVLFGHSNVEKSVTCYALGIRLSTLFNCHHDFPSIEAERLNSVCFTSLKLRSITAIVSAIDHLIIISGVNFPCSYL